MLKNLHAFFYLKVQKYFKVHFYNFKLQMEEDTYPINSNQLRSECSANAYHTSLTSFSALEESLINLRQII